MSGEHESSADPFPAEIWMRQEPQVTPALTPRGFVGTASSTQVMLEQQIPQGAVAGVSQAGSLSHRHPSDEEASPGLGHSTQTFL